MTEAICSALILNSDEFAVIAGMRNDNHFIGYQLPKESQEIQERYKGLNSLIRRKILIRCKDEYYINDAYRNLIQAVVNMKMCFVISNNIGIIYCSETLCLVRTIEAVSPMYSLMTVTPDSFVQLLLDEGLIPDKDEYDFMMKSVEPLTQQGFQNDDENLIIKISKYSSKRYVEIRRIGLCMMIITMNAQGAAFERYTVAGFKRILEYLLKG